MTYHLCSSSSKICLMAILHHGLLSHLSVDQNPISSPVVQQFCSWMPPCILCTFKTILVSQTRTCVSAGLTCDWVLAAMTLLGHISLEAVHAVNAVLMGSEARSGQRFTAGVAHKTLGVPRLVLVADPSRGDGLRGTEEHFGHDLKHYKAGASFIQKTDEYFYNHKTYTVIQSALVPACSGSISWQTSCHGRERRRCHHPWSGSSVCGLAACIQSRWSIPHATPCSCTPHSGILKCQHKIEQTIQAVNGLSPLVYP